MGIYPIRLATAILFALIIQPFAEAEVLKVIDSQERTIVPADYDSITVAAKGKYLELQKTVSSNGGAITTKSYVDLDGKAIQSSTIANIEKRVFKLPDGYSIALEQENHIYVRGPQGMGVYSKSGRQIIPPIYGEISPKGEHRLTATKFGASPQQYLLDDAGRVISELPEWIRSTAPHFQEGLLKVNDSFGESKFVDRKGKIVRFPNFPEVQGFWEGLSSISYVKDNERWGGYINRKGKLVIGPFKNTSCEVFSNGVAKITAYEADGRQTAAIVDIHGNFVIPFGRYDSLSSNQDGTWLATEKGKFMVLDRSGKTLVNFPDNCTSVELPQHFKSTTWIPCGFGGTENRQKYTGKIGSKWGYCDGNGKVVMTPRFDFCGPFETDKATAYVLANDDELLCGVINRRGEWILKPRYAWCQILSSNRFIVAGDLDKKDNTISSKDKELSTVAFLSNLLAKNDFIDMSKSDLDRILATSMNSKEQIQTNINNPNIVAISITGLKRNQHDANTLEFLLNSSQRVSGWRCTETANGSQQLPWITENVVLVNPDGAINLGNLVPKRDVPLDKAE